MTGNTRGSAPVKCAGPWIWTGLSWRRYSGQAVVAIVEPHCRRDDRWAWSARATVDRKLYDTLEAACDKADAHLLSLGFELTGGAP